MEPLGVINYVKNNGKRLIATMIIISFSSFLLYFTFGIGSAIKFGLMDEIVEPYRSMTLFYPFKEEVKTSTLEKLKSMDEVDKIIECSLQNTTVDMIVGKSGTNLIKISREEVKTLLDKMNLKLITGNYAENYNDMIVNERVLRGMNKKIGDYVGDEVDEKSLIKGKYKIVGTYSGNSNNYIVVGSDTDKKGVFLIFGKKDGQKTINNYLNTLNKEDRNLISLEYMEDNIGHVKPMLYAVGAIICFIFIIVLSIIIWNIIYINMVARRKEISLIKAVGYSNKFIKRKLLKENIISFLTSVILGNIFGIAGLKVFYEVYCYPKGFDMDVFSPVYLLATLLVPLTVLIISLIPISRGLKKIDAISVLEGNI